MRKISNSGKSPIIVDHHSVWAGINKYISLFAMISVLLSLQTACSKSESQSSESIQNQSVPSGEVTNNTSFDSVPDESSVTESSVVETTETSATTPPVEYDDSAKIEGLLYVWNQEDSKYPISSSKGIVTSSADTYGDFSIDGALRSVELNNGYKSFLVRDGAVKFNYLYDDKLISDNDSDDVNLHITSDGNKSVDGIELDSKIKSGTILIQTSVDGENWINDTVNTDVFNTTRTQTGSMYLTNDLQLQNGTYYRIIVAYRLRKLTGSHGTFFKTKDYDYFEKAEVYEFYIKNEESDKYNVVSNTRKALGEPVNAGSHNGFSSTDHIERSDYHYGWQLGSFYVSGYSDLVTSPNGDNVFLKTTGDKVELSFELMQDINSLNGSKDLVINDDGDGTDEYFQTDRNVKFRKGALIIRHTDYQGIKTTPQIYTNFLEANTKVGANTRISLFEEGDYEVALDYEICNKYGIDTYQNYRIFFNKS